MKFIKTLFVLITLATFTACSVGTQDISDIKTGDYVDREVSVYGTVGQSIKIGDLSGYIIEDETGSIAVASDSIPAEGDEVRVNGTLKKNVLGYYIQTE